MSADKVEIERSEDGNFVRVTINERHAATVTIAEWSAAVAHPGSFWTGRYGKIKPLGAPPDQ